MRNTRIILGVVVVVGIVVALVGLLGRATAEADPAKIEFICESGKLTLNGKDIIFPCELAALTAVLGEPDRAPKGAFKPYQPVPIWDKLGIICHPNDDGLLKDISFQIAENPRPTGGEYAQKGIYTGRLTIDGVQFQGGVTMKDFREKRKPSGEQLKGGQWIQYANGNSLTLDCKEPPDGPIWRVAVFVRTTD